MKKSVLRKNFIQNRKSISFEQKAKFDSEILDNIKGFNGLLNFKNIFIYFDTHKKHFDRPGYPLYLSVRELIKTDSLRSDDLEFCFIMLLHHTFMTLTYCINNNCLDDKEQFIKKLNILCYGIYK